MTPSTPARCALILLSLLLAGCLPGLRGETTPIQVVSLSIRIETDPDWPQVDLALNVRRPQADQMLDGFRLLVRQDRHRLLTYPGLAWADTTANLLQAELIQGLLDSRRFTGGVGRPGDIRAHGTLMSIIRHFELVDDGQGGRHVHLEVSARLTRNRDSRQVAGENFVVIRPVASADVAAMLDAYEAATTELVERMIEWSLKEALHQKEKLEAAGMS
ncbi:MAG TPA: ABC-type transport auxiliary lipoprotein family protein [Desulfobacterales bacterium]